ncbi:hypothetical protein KR059_003697, partial [Drosophila kikkawai]
PICQLVFSFGLGYFVTTRLSQMYTKLKGNASEFSTDDKSPEENEVILLNIKQLAAFNGLNPDQPVYTALNGKIYDLSPDREKFSKQGIYSHLAGCDANKVLHIACYSLGVCENDFINRWEQRLRAEFNMVGYLIDSDMQNDDEDTEMIDRSETSETHTEDYRG